jgi:hypothetical protein
MKVKGKFPRRKLRSRWKQHVRKDVIHKEEWEQIAEEKL